MVNLGPARGPKRAGTGRAGPENPGPWAFTGRNGPNYYFYLRVIYLFIVRWALGSNKGIMNCYNLNVLCIKQMYNISTKIFTHDANGLSKFN